MRLKRLTIKGFKSFADETVINFSENLIGIVGPNGSGKSNIVDSIRWVLGEQKTSELRLENMSDVLFNGTKARKEGRVAKVTLSFDNTKNILPTEYNEVSISRILYRDGTSEYRLNDVTCRKKDITTLFLDSGIGSNSYAIISLNMVEDILHDKGGSRRYMIEQAAGISKYKVRKKETLSKLRSTAEDLERVSDLLYEIEKSMSSFERQAKRTEKYNLLKEEYKELSINISKREIKEISDQLKSLREKLQQEEDQKIHLEKEINEKSAVLERLKVRILEAEKSLSQDQQTFNALIEKLGRTENEKNLLNQQVINSQERLRDIAQDEVQLKESVERSTEQIEIAVEKKEAYSAQLNESKANLESANEQYLTLQGIYQDLRLQEKKIKDEVAAKQQIKSNTERELESYKTKVELIKGDIEKLEERRASFESTQGQKLKDYEELKEDFEILKTQNEQLEATIEDLESQDADLFAQINDTRGKKNKKELEESSLQQRIKFLQNVIEKNEGVPESTKFLLKQNKNLSLFSDIITVDDDRYTSIIELFFEPYLHYLVARDRAEALRYYQSVREAQKGKVKVFVLEDFGAKPTVAKPDLIPITEVISVQAGYESLVEHIAHRVYIYSGPINGLRDMNLDHEDIILSNEGYLIYGQGEIYGGSNTLFEGVQLGRKQILEKLYSSKDKIIDEIERIEGEVIKLKNEKQQIQIKLENAKKERKLKSREAQQKQQAVYQLESSLYNFKENISQIDRQKDDKRAQLEEAQQHVIVKEKQLEELSAMKIDELSDDELTGKIADIYGQMAVASESKEKSQQKVYELQGQVNILTKEVEFHQNTKKSVEARVNNIDGERETLSNKIKEGEYHLALTKTKLSKLYEERETLQSKLSEHEDSYYKEKGKIFEREKELSEYRSKLNQRESVITALNEKMSNAKFELKAVHDRNEIEFGFRIMEVNIDEAYLSIDLNQLKLKKSKLQDKIKGFGEINPMAITAYNEIKERHEHITKERNDIFEAKESLEATIAEIEEAASIKFNESLSQIRENFKNVFQGLFSEDDDCDIILMDTDDPLEARIEIVAKPKGKRPKSINQLSGGEKTLTAASFLFALYLLKPAPFCIFDEVDAPLDDVNVQKFNKIIRKFSQDSQFIMITHNKLTMAEVDILYGVFLKEQGVSGVSAVDFRTYDSAELLTAE